VFGLSVSVLIENNEYNTLMCMYVVCDLQRNLIVNRVALIKLTPSMWHARHFTVIEQFIVEHQHRILCVYLDTIHGLVLDLNVPYIAVPEMTYFIKKQDIAALRFETFLQDIQVGQTVV